MIRPPTSRQYRAIVTPSLRSLLALFALAGAFPLGLLLVSAPLTGVIVLGVIGSGIVVIRRGMRLLRYFYECGGFVVKLGGTVRITIARPDVTDDICYA